MEGKETSEKPKVKYPIETETSAMNEDTDAELGELEEMVMKKAGISATQSLQSSSGQNDSVAKGTSKTLLAPSTTTPGAFAVDNPLRDESSPGSILEEDGPTQSIAGDSQSLTLTAQSSSAGVVTDTSLTTAEAVAIAMADPVDNENTADEPSNSVGSKSSLGDGNKRKKTTLFVAVIAVLAILAIVFGVVFSRRNDPLEERRNDMVNFLSRLTPVEAFESNGSKYNADRMAALQWIVEDDPMQLPIPTDDLPNNDPEAWALLQRYSLAVFHFATNGERWLNNFLFLSEFDVCRWSTVGMSDSFWSGGEVRDFDVKGVTCDSDGRVNAFRLYWNKLSGTLPDELGLFSDTLIQFVLAGGSMTGTIPSFLESFSSLENLALNDNCFTGAVPQGMSELPSLQYFAFYSNKNLDPGSAEDFCASTSSASSPAYQEGTLGVFLDSKIECSCCTSCRPDVFECDDQILNITYPTVNVYNPDARDSQGNMLQFQKECISPEELEWVAEQCPCVVPLETEDSVAYTDTSFIGRCGDCTEPDAYPSTGRD